MQLDPTNSPMQTARLNADRGRSTSGFSRVLPGSGPLNMSDGTVTRAAVTASVCLWRWGRFYFVALLFCVSSTFFEARPSTYGYAAHPDN